MRKYFWWHTSEHPGIHVQHVEGCRGDNLYRGAHVSARVPSPL